MKKTIISLLILIIIILCVVSMNNVHVGKKYVTIAENSDKIQIVTTIFPLYDFINNIGKDKVDVNMLIPAGVDVNDYEPTPQDIMMINESDLFIYMGEDIEYWAKTLVNSLDDKVKIIDVTENIDLIEKEKFEENHNIKENDSHNHDLEKYDTHIWLDPLKSIQMVNNINQKLCEIDTENSNYYEYNTKNYLSDLEKLDSDFLNLTQNNSKKIAFGGPFAYSYFVDRYNLDFISAYDSCGENGEPSVFKLKEIINQINENDINVIFYKEFSSASIANTISEETGAKMLEFNSIHTVTQEDLDNKVSYISLMKKNLENLKEALK